MFQAHNLINAIRAKRVTGLWDEDDRAWAIHQITKAEKFLFDFGENEWPTVSETQFRAALYDLRLPFDLCYFEIPSPRGAVLIRDHGATAPLLFHMFLHLRRENMWTTYPPGAATALDRNTAEIVTCSEDPTVAALLDRLMNETGSLGIATYGILSLVVRGLMVMNCSNVMCVDNPVPAQRSKKHTKRGHQPPFSYKTLHIKVPRTLNDPSNAEHGERAGPRLHLRRGHIRRLDETRTTWVQSCMVGNPAAGTIHKDYRVTP